MDGMKCGKCGAPATIFISEIANGKYSQIYLCNNCARHREENLFHQSCRQQAPSKDLVCPKCKTRLSEFLKSGFLGCNDCYVAFSSEIDKTLLGIQGKNQHIPRDRREAIGAGDPISVLKAELDRASKEMRYDDADRIFRQLKKLQGDL